MCASPGTSSGGSGSSANMMRAGSIALMIVHRRIHRSRPAVEIDHDVDFGSDRVAQGADHVGHGVDVLGRRNIVGVGNAHDLDGVVAGLRDDAAALDDGIGRVAFVDRLHVAEPEMGVGAQMVAHLAAEQAPHRHAERFAENVPQRDLDA